MSELTFCVKNGKGCVRSNGQEKELAKDFMVELFQNLLGVVSPDRDYTSVTSLRKLLRVIDLEFEPDESDDEAESEKEDSDHDSEEEEPEPPKQVGNPKRVVKRPLPRKPAPPVKEESEEESDETEDEE